MAIAFSIYVYRRTNPIVPTFVRILLTSIRAIILLLVLFIIFETIVNIHIDKTNPPVIAVAVDNSASMTLTDSQGDRTDILKSILTANFYDQLEENFSVKYYTFSNDIQPFSPQRGDTLQFPGDVTNIREGLEKIKADNVTENLTNILLISDGSYNDGGNPVRYAEEIGVPVHSIGIGSDEPVTDLAITDIDANPFAYAGQTTPVQITVRNTGFSRLSVPIELRQENKILERQSLEVSPSPSENSVTFNFTPSDIGRQKLTVVIPPQVREHLVENNSRSFYVDVLKSKLNILLIAGSVSPDISFITRILQNDRYDVSSLVHKNNGQFYQQPPTTEQLHDIDIFIFLDFPMRGGDAAFLQNLQSSIEQKKQAVLIIPGFNTSFSDLNRFANYIPLQTASPIAKAEQISVELSPLGATHPVMQVTSDPVLSQTIWRQLPPVFSPYMVRQLSPGSEVLAYARSEQQSSRVTPLLSIRTNGVQKSAAIFASELWRWDFMMRGINRTEDVYSRLLQNIMRWLETNRSESLLRVTMDKSQYRYGDPIGMKIEVYDENFNPVENADVQVRLQRGGEKQEFAAQAVGNGTYNAAVQAPRPGDYQAVVNATIDGRPLAEETVLFSVGEYSAELTDIPARPSVLKNLSLATGGAFVSGDSLAQIFQYLHGEETITPVNVENELWNNKILLFVLLFLLTLEWFIRKRRGMV